MATKNRIRKSAKNSEDGQPTRPTLAEAVAALQERELRLAAILETAADAIITIDKRGIIVSVNPATERLFGYAADELIGQNVKLLMPSPYAEEHDGYIASYLKTGVARIIGTGRETVAKRRDGMVFPVDLAVSEVDHLQMFTAILRDISERKQLQREIVEIAHLEQQRLGADLHDACGQELTALGLLASSLVQSLEHRAPKEVEVARKIGEGLRRVLQYVRDVARGLSKGDLDPAELPRALEELTARLSETSRISCVFQGDAPVAMEDRIVATHLYHIAQEACTNALKHAAAGKVQVQLASRSGVVTLRIRDDGIGIANDAREGLGLRIMRNRASVIGATLTIERGKRGGTVVTCTLPTEPRHAPRQG